jgi:phenylacetate-CoA ligase
MEDEHGRMQPNREHAYLETVDGDEGGVGDLVVTTLTNDYMPLLRYRIGDLAERVENGYVVHGRHRDALRSADGHLVTTWAVDQCFATLDGVMHYELRQDEEGNARLRFIPDGNGPDGSQLREAASRVEALLRSSRPITVEQVAMLPPAPSGKFRLTSRR